MSVTGGYLLTWFKSGSSSIIQGWDSSAFTWISVEQKLKSVVDDDHFRGKKIDEKKKKNL